MRIDMTATLKQITGEPLVVDGKPVLASIISINALLLSTAANAKDTGDQKLLKFQLAQSIQIRPEAVELSVENAAMLKKLIGEMYGPLIVGQMYPLLDG